MRDRRPDLWRDGDFLKLWLGQTISLFGSQVTTLALPLTAVLLNVNRRYKVSSGIKVTGLP